MCTDAVREVYVNMCAGGFFFLSYLGRDPVATAQQPLLYFNS